MIDACKSRNVPGALIFLDLKAAFDSVAKQILVRPPNAVSAEEHRNMLDKLGRGPASADNFFNSVALCSSESCRALNALTVRNGAASAVLLLSVYSFGVYSTVIVSTGCFCPIFSCYIICLATAVLAYVEAIVFPYGFTNLSPVSTN